MNMKINCFLLTKVSIISNIITNLSKKKLTLSPRLKCFKIKFDHIKVGLRCGKELKLKYLT